VSVDVLNTDTLQRLSDEQEQDDRIKLLTLVVSVIGDEEQAAV
jgi:hypothetical protein